MGEVRAAKPLVFKLLSEYKQTSFLITTSTPTGKEEALKIIHQISQSHIKLVITHCYLPIDWYFACHRFVKRVSPKITILMETELWPNLLHHLSKKNIPSLLANARLSDSSLNKYLQHAALSEEVFSNISLIAAQFESDSINFKKLAVADNKIRLVGSIKFDIEITTDLIKQQALLKQKWTANRPSWIAASIHPGEFKNILNAHKELLVNFPDCLLIVVPRHPEQFDLMKTLCKKNNFSFICRSENKIPTNKHNIIIGDTMGEITLMCGVADLAFVGGSLINRGGHNPLEPAACGLPVFMGHSDYNFSDICQMMEKNNVLSKVNDHHQLAQSISQLFSNPVMLESKSKASQAFIALNRGSVNKMLIIVKELLRT